MKVLIDKEGDFGFVTTKEAFHGRILDRKHQEIAPNEYDNSTQRAKLLITMGEDSISLGTLVSFWRVQRVIFLSMEKNTDGIIIRNRTAWK